MPSTTFAPFDGGADTITVRVDGEQRRYVRDLFDSDRWWLFTAAGREERASEQVAHEITGVVFTPLRTP